MSTHFLYQWQLLSVLGLDRIMEQHSREVTEMEQILQEQIMLAQEDSMQKVCWM